MRRTDRRWGGAARRIARGWAAIAVATALACAGGPVLAAAPSTPGAEQPRPRARVQVDASALGSDGPAIGRLVREGAVDTLQRAGIATVDDPEAPVVILDVTVLSGATPGYRCAYEVRDGGDVVPG